MGTIMAPRRNQDAAVVASHPSPKPSKARVRTKASAIPASGRSTADTSNPSSLTSHAPAASRAASSTSTPISTSVASQTVGSTSIGALGRSGAMNVNANIKPNLQPAPTPVQTHIPNNPPSQQPNLRQGGPSPTSLQFQNSRPSSIVHQQQQHHPGSPAQSQPHGQYSGGSHGSGGNIGLQQHHQFVPSHAGGDPQQANQTITYLQGPYGQQPGSFQVSEDGRVLMAATMPSYPNMYNNQQPQSPATVSSPHSHDVHNRQFLSQAQSQMATSMYNNFPQYHQPLSHVQQPSYAHPARTQAPQGLPAQPLLMSHQQSPPQMQQQHTRSPTGIQQSPRSKLEPSAMPMHRPIDTAAAMHRPPQQIITNTQQMPPGSAGSIQQSPRSGGGQNSSAAPGPIPASTPRVIREDADGTLWIEFEYSKDRVKMDYSIKCNIESVDLSTLSDEFKMNNCVYPRAMKPKNEYQGNRYNYETECNNVGWALAKMNETLQGKRGLIQRAVDSWRNSNQDMKLRSRRVRRQQKIAKRDKDRSSAGPGQGPVVPGTPITAQRPQSMHGPGGMDMGGAQPYHHPGVGGPPGVAGGGEDVVHGAGLSTSIRPDQNFHRSSLPNYASILSPASGGSSMHPTSESMDPLSPHRFSQPISTLHRHGGSVSSSIEFGAMPLSGSVGGAGAGEKRKRERSEDEHNRELYGDLRENKRPKFIVVDDTMKGSRVRVKVTLDQVKMGDIPDSFRKSLSVYHRAYVPVQMQDETGQRLHRCGARWVEEGEVGLPTPSGMGAEVEEGDAGRALTGRTMIKLRNINGGEAAEDFDDGTETESGRQRPGAIPTRRELTMMIPRLSKGKWRKDSLLNELGYRMSWNQNRVFAGRLLFLQRSLDLYRTKMKTTIVNMAAGAENTENEGGEEVASTTPSVNPHFEMRVGKAKWNAGKKARSERDEESH